MKHARLFSRLVLVLVMPLPVTPVLAAQAASIQMNLLADWTSQKDTLMKIAAAMPEDRLGYKPTPPQRNYGDKALEDSFDYGTAVIKEQAGQPASVNGQSFFGL